MRAASVEKALRALGTPERAKNLSWFFKAGPGEYGEGDIFVGVTVPAQRKVAAQYSNLPLPEIEKLVRSPIHECRLTALLILVHQYKKAPPQDQAKLVTFYLTHAQNINNWDLVDLSAPYILGHHLLTHDRRILHKLARSKNIWERRIAIVSTFTLIRENQFDDTLALTELLMADTHDLIHKALGWMLREVGKRSKPTLVAFLTTHAPTLPRTTLRYAIERFPARERKKFLAIPRIH